MRGKWALVAGAVIALVIVGGVGGLTMRAFAGVTHSAAKPKTVTQLCVYVDHVHGGSSNGDLSVNKKYGHETCIEGKRGPAGNSSVVTWNKTVATPSVAGAKPFGSSAHFVDLAKIGPFTIRGYCSASEGVAAVTHVLSTQDGSSLAWDDSVLAGSFNSGDDTQVSNIASGNTQSPGFATEYGNGEFSITTADQKTAFTGWATNGVYLNGAEGPACSFIGHIVLEG
jgi:hypothetical protein